MLGAGLGAEPAYETVGVPWEPRRLGRRYDEALEVITGLWSGEPFSYDGEHFTLDEAVLLPTPVQQPRIPVVAGCWWPNKRPFRRGARYDGIMPNWKSLFGRGPHGGTDGSPEIELTELLEYYHGLTDDPGEIVLPIDPVGASDAYVETGLELGVTWFLTTNYPVPEKVDAERIRAGPPDLR